MATCEKCGRQPGYEAGQCASAAAASPSLMARSECAAHAEIAANRRAFSDGMESYRTGRRADDNPHAPGSVAAMLWAQGWGKASSDAACEARDAEIATLRARVEALTEALRPFARLDLTGEHERSHLIVINGASITATDLRACQRALTATAPTALDELRGHVADALWALGTVADKIASPNDRPIMKAIRILRGATAPTARDEVKP